MTSQEGTGKEDAGSIGKEEVAIVSESLEANESPAIPSTIPIAESVARQQTWVTRLTFLFRLLIAAGVIITLVLIVQLNGKQAQQSIAAQVRAQEAFSKILSEMRTELEKQLHSHDINVQRELRELLRNTKFIIEVQDQPTSRHVVITRVIISPTPFPSPYPSPCKRKGCK